MADVPPATGARPGTAVRPDLKLIADMIAPGSRVLDVGCGDGELLQHLVRTRGVDGRGIEISQEGVNRGVARGLSIIQGDADDDLAVYPERSFDYVILSRTLQAVYEPKAVLESLVRIGERAIVSLLNFGYWRLRLELLARGRMPTSRLLDSPWWETQNIHLCSISDFVALCDEIGITIEQKTFLDTDGQVLRGAAANGLSNLLAAQAIMVLRRG